MKNRTKVILWTSPLMVIFLEIFIVYIGAGVLIPWKLVGKPSEDVSKIIGVYQDKFYVSANSGAMFSLQWAGNSIPLPAAWVLEKEFPTGPELVCQFSCGHEGGPWTASPPLFVQVKQIYKYRIYGEGGTLVYKFVLSNDGNIWYWERGYRSN